MILVIRPVWIHSKNPRGLINCEWGRALISPPNLSIREKDMGAFRNLNGRVFGKLTVVGHCQDQSVQKGTLWNCRCECGNFHIVNGGNLLTGRTRSCGCYQFLWGRFPEEERNFRLWFSNYQSNAKTRKIEFSIGVEDFRKLVSAPCQYCRKDPKPYRGYGRDETAPYFCNGLDRVDNTKGYTASNCVPCCTVCNLMKRGMTVEQFLSHVQSIALNNKENDNRE